MRIALALLVSLFVTNANADSLQVTEDQTKIMKLRAPIADLIIGNPSIADVAFLGESHLALTGKTFGVTNLIARDAAGAILLDAEVRVEPADGPVVTLRKASTVVKYLCDDRCQLMAAQQIPSADDEAGAGEGYRGDRSRSCDSPTQTAIDGSRCGGRSAWSREGGRSGTPPGYFKASIID